MKPTNKLELVGILLIYAVSLFFFGGMVLIWFYDGIYFGQVIVAIIALFVFFVTLFYHSGLIENWKLMALIGFLSTVFGGLFIYVSRASEENKYKELSYEEKFAIKSPLESKLEEIALLLEKGVITKSEHDNKRQKLIDQY